MARGQTLTTLLALLKAELREAQETNTSLDAEFAYALSNRQKSFAIDYNWPFLERDWDLSCGVASRYLDIPSTDTRSATATINFERPVMVMRKWGSFYEPITYGIGPEEYNLHEGTSELQDPIQRWRFSTNVNEAANPSEIEIWPSPATAQTLRFTGQRQLLALAVAADTADLDDLLLVYHVAADYLAQREQTNAPLAVKKAQERLMKLRAGYPVIDQPMVIGRRPFQDRQNVKLIAVA